MSSKARVLVIRFSSIGDIVLTTPVIRALHEQLAGGAEVHVLTKKKFSVVLENNPYIHQLHVMDQSIQEVIPALKELDFDYVIDLHNNIRSRIVKRGLKRLSFTFKKLNFEKWLLVNTGINRMPDVHVVDRYMDTLRAFQVKSDGKGLDYFLPEHLELPEGFPTEEYAAWAIGAAHEGKQMSKEKIAAVIAQLPFPVVLLGGKEDADNGAWLSQQLGNKVVDFTGKLSLHQSALASKKARLVVCGDTGMMHIASAFQKPIVSLWGCTTPSLGMYPYRPHASSVIMEPHGRKKRPCSKLGNRCKYGMNHKCIDQIAESELVSMIVKVYNSAQ